MIYYYILYSLTPQYMYPEIIVKGVMMGDYNVGKSSIFQRYMADALKNIHPTIGVDYQSKTEDIQGTCVQLNLWDTAGQERFRSIVKVYVRRMFVFFLVFDVTQRSSFVNLDHWLSFIQNHSYGPCYIILVANKIDMESSSWQVSEQDIMNFVDNHKDINKLYFITTKSKLESKPILHSNEQESIAAMFHKTMIDVYTLVNTSPKETCGIIDKRCSYNAELHTPPGSPPSSADVMTSFGFKQYSPPATETCKSLTKSVRLCNC